MITPDERQICKRYDDWLRKFFGLQGLTLSKKAPYSTNVFTDSNGDLLIDHGRLHLSIKREQDFTCYTLITTGEDGGKRLSTRVHLHDLLFDGLYHAIRRHHIDHH